MRSVLTLIALLLICMSAFGATPQETEMSQVEAAAHMAHENYVTAINSNNLEAVMEMLTDDVVFMAANNPVMEGKAVIKPWVEGYLNAFTTHWVKTVDEFVITGEYAFERYSYKSTDTSKADGSVIEDTGWGLLIYHYDADGKWRVARDAWGPDHPASN